MTTLLEIRHGSSKISGTLSRFQRQRRCQGYVARFWKWNPQSRHSSVSIELFLSSVPTTVKQVVDAGQFLLDATLAVMHDHPEVYSIHTEVTNLDEIPSH